MYIYLSTGARGFTARRKPGYPRERESLVYGLARGKFMRRPARNFFRARHPRNLQQLYTRPAATIAGLRNNFGSVGPCVVARGDYSF